MSCGTPGKSLNYIVKVPKLVPRADNCAADAAANWALDHETIADEDVLEKLSSEGPLLGLVFSFDGAARGV